MSRPAGTEPNIAARDLAALRLSASGETMFYANMEPSEE